MGNVIHGRINHTGELTTIHPTRQPSTPNLIPHPSMTRNKSNEGQLFLALQAVQQDPQLTIRAAAKLYKVDHVTLGRRQRGLPSRRDVPINSRKLTNSEESAIVQYILDLDSRAFPPRLSGVEDMANRLLADRDAGRVGINWASNFVQRQPQLKTRLNRRIDYQRVQCEDPVRYQA